MPSPFVFAIGLTYVVFLAGLLVEGRSPVEMVQFWQDGFWNLLSFGMQMVLILATGYVLAYHPLVQRGIDRLTAMPSTGPQAVVLVGAVSMVVAWIQWGLGLIVGAILAREMGRRAHKRQIPVHYPLLCVAGYMGLGLTWHWGLAASGPLLMNTPGNVFIEAGIVDGLVSTSQTIFHPYTLALVVLGIAYSLGVLYVLTPPESESEPITAFLDEAERSATTDRSSGRTNDASGQSEDGWTTGRLLGGLLAVGGVVVTIATFVTEGLGALNLDVVNFGMLFVGLALYSAPQAYQAAFDDAITATSGIVLQFPFYAGIMGMMNASGLSATIADQLIAVSTPTTFPAIAWLTAGIVNVFVPSGGGEWTVIGPSILTAAADLGVPVGQATVAYAVGDAHTNLLQPFWALPLLGITGMAARDVFGYAVTMLLALIPFLAVALIVIPY